MRWWLKLASHLHRPLHVVKEETSVDDFWLWKVYLDESVNHFHREDWIAAKVCTVLVWAFTSQWINPDQFLLGKLDQMEETNTKTIDKPKEELAPGEKKKFTPAQQAAIFRMKVAVAARAGIDIKTMMKRGQNGNQPVSGS